MENLAQAIVDKKFKVGEYIQEIEQTADAAMYLVREGSVSIHTSDDNSVKTIEAGGYFGDDQLLLDAKEMADSQGCVTSRITARCEKDTVVGVLTLQECRLLFDTTCFKVEEETNDKKVEDTDLYDLNRSSTAILKRRSTIRESFKSNKISMDDLDRNDLLGEGKSVSRVQ